MNEKLLEILGDYCTWVEDVSLRLSYSNTCWLAHLMMLSSAKNPT